MKSGIVGVSLRVNNLDKSLTFYSESLGMKILSKDLTSAALAFNDDGKKLEIIEKPSFKKGDAFVGIGVKAPDAIVRFSRAAALGSEVLTPFDTYAYGASLVPDEDELKQFPISYGKIKDPDGYIVELTEGVSEDPLYKVVLNVEDLNDSIAFYTNKVKMNLLRRRANVNNKPKSASMCAYVVRFCDVQ